MSNCVYNDGYATRELVFQSGHSAGLTDSQTSRMAPLILNALSAILTGDTPISAMSGTYAAGMAEWEIIFGFETAAGFWQWWHDSECWQWRSDSLAEFVSPGADMTETAYDIAADMARAHMLSVWDTHKAMCEGCNA